MFKTKASIRRNLTSEKLIRLPDAEFDVDGVLFSTRNLGKSGWTVQLVSKEKDYGWDGAKAGCVILFFLPPKTSVGNKMSIVFRVNNFVYENDESLENIWNFLNRKQMSLQNIKIALNFNNDI